MKLDKRTFTVINNDKSSEGHYVSKTPGAAAKKAANKLFKNDSKKNTLTFTIRETTRDSKKNTYTYTAKKKSLKPPKKVMIAGKEVVIKHEISMKAVKTKKQNGGEDDGQWIDKSLFDLESMPGHTAKVRNGAPVGVCKNSIGSSYSCPELKRKTANI